MPVILDLKTTASFLNNNMKNNFSICIPYPDDKQMAMEEAEKVKEISQAVKVTPLQL